MRLPSASIFSLDRNIAKISHDIDHERTCGRLVIDHQHRFASARRWGIGANFACGHVLLGRQVALALPRHASQHIVEIVRESPGHRGG